MRCYAYMAHFKLYISLAVLTLMSWTEASAQDEKVFWTDSLEFSWDLFKEKRSGYSYIKAMTHSGIMYEVNEVDGKVDIKVSAYFIYGKSWVMKGYKKPKLLKHEKVHFDIAEIFKRKLDKLFDKYRVDFQDFVDNDSYKDLQKDFDRIFNEMDAFQDKYDRETKHGVESEKQLEWEEKIRKLLED